ncbi:MAG: class I tRNA ligase family protein [Candidatus Berkelbacteria bacterium]|nr:class I tRNA ligase family protein [Candidatus Berkelbacteria bacterium]
MKLSKTYDPSKVEGKIYRFWEKKKCFKPELKPKAKPYCIIMPPPNANAPMHLGHAVFVTLEDLMIRYKRMKGMAALWLPGADHAGFETQVVFEKKLEKQGRNRFEIPREILFREMWDFTQENKKTTENQLKKLGASCDWDREKFTLDPDIIKIVYRTFKKLYDDGLIYRQYRPVNWCPKHKTALSDLETKYIEKNDPLYYIKYGPLTLATVRPETKFGDTAVAVNPKDKRYQKYIKKEIKAKGILGPLKFKVIADEAVDPKFGTGVVKVTPAHDPIDFEIWQRHEKEIPGPCIVINESGRLTKETGKFAGLKVLEAREKVVEEMKKIGILEKIDSSYKHTIATCYKCGNTVEPLPKEQWFVAVNKKGKSGKALAPDALKAVKEKKVQFVTKRFEKIFNHWMQNIRDWNISRQIVWGIRIPVWYCQNTKPFEDKKMGFAGNIVPQVFKNKTKTYRLRDHCFKVSDKVAFENSQKGEIFGYGTIIEIKKTTVEKVDLKDPKHGTTYKKLDELILAFKKHHPDKKVTPKTLVWIYIYKFEEKKKCSPLITLGQKPAQCPICGDKNLSQDPDVFDTWFSSGQWPFATLQTTKPGDFEKFYPTEIMETGWDILFFWVARMIMLGLYETGKVPFKKVYLHGLVRDKDRQKMSKSKGNVIDPLGVAEQYGTDAIRMALVFGTNAGNDIIISEEKIRGMRNFANKVWNVARFVLMQTEIVASSEAQSGSQAHWKAEGRTNKAHIFERQASPKTIADRKILQKLDSLIAKIDKDLNNFRFGQAASDLYDFIWHDFADKYIEESKNQLQDEKTKQNTQETLLYTLKTSLKLLHPFMPYVTEEIWGRLPGYKKPLIVSDWPK